MTDWNDPKSMVSQHFSVHECTYLPSWGCHHAPSDEEKANLTRMAAKADEIRGKLGRPMTIHVWIRPQHLNCPDFDPSTVTVENDPDGKKQAALDALDYNAYVGGAGHSAHVLGLAIDYDAGEDCDTTRDTMEPELAPMGLRMERKPGSKWVHNDVMPVPPGGHAYFIP
jgi:hypothetical protein